MNKALDCTLLLKLLEEQVEQNKKLQEELSQLRHQLATLQIMLFGQKSEKKRNLSKEPPIEHTAQENKLRATPSQPVQESENKSGRRSLPIHLEREKIKHDIPEEERVCPNCQIYLHCIGKEVTEQLDFIPARLIVKEHIRYKYGCRCCKRHVATAPLPSQPIDKALAGSGLLAEVLVNKYQDALPLYRQQQRWARLGYELPRSTLCDWVMQCAERLQPIVEAMKLQCLLPARKIHTDDTVFPILDTGKTHNGRLWVYLGCADNAPPCAIYQYTKTRAQAHPQKFLSGYQGYLQADAYPGYDKLYQDGKIIEVTCFAHARRKFTDVAKSVKEPTFANQAIEYIGQLYAIEHHAKAMTMNQRYYYRKRLAKPILKAFYKWLKRQTPVTPPKSPLGLAMQYSLNHWKGLNNYLLDGVLDIDNNRAERAIKPFVIGRKNFLFAGSHQGAEHAATIYSLIESCKMLNINTFDYFKDVLARLPTTLNKNIADLFPCNWRPV